MPSEHAKELAARFIKECDETAGSLPPDPDMLLPGEYEKEVARDKELTMYALAELIDEAVEAERERCAVAAAEWLAVHRHKVDSLVAEEGIAAAVRASGKDPTDGNDKSPTPTP